MTTRTVAATGLLGRYDAGVFEPADVHVAQRLTTLAGEADERVALAVALRGAGAARRIGVRGSAVGARRSSRSRTCLAGDRDG